MAEFLFTFDKSLNPFNCTRVVYNTINEKGYSILSVNVIVLRYDDLGPQILLVQRAKDEIAFPGHWEFPGGKAEDDDSSLLEAAAREFYEETHGRISHFERVVHQREFDHRIDKTIKGLKITFEAKIEEWSVVLNPKEHQEYLWATKDEVLGMKAKGSKFIHPQDYQAILAALAI